MRVTNLDWSVLRRHRALVFVTLVQAVCAVYFIYDWTREIPNIAFDPVHPIAEGLADVGLVVGALFGLRALLGILERQVRLEDRMRAATGAFVDLMEDSFVRWGLTASERDVALLSIKGLGIAEIAALRGTRVGTVKAQCAAVYRKAGVGGRAELLGLFIEDLVDGMELAPRPAPRPPEADATNVAVP